VLENVKNVAILGSSGTIGSLVGGLTAQQGIRTFFLSRTQAGAQRGLGQAIAQARSETIGRYVTDSRFFERGAD
jgi:hypothetical protein